METNKLYEIKAHAVEVLTPEEEITLEFIKNKWEKDRVKSTIKDITDWLEKIYGYKSQEKARQVLMSLFKKGQVLIDVKGRELLCRPNHVVVFSKTTPIDFRNLTILDKETNFPVSRIWFSIYKDENGQKYLNITESKRGQRGWETVNNIIIPPEAIQPYLELMQYIDEKLK